MSKIIICSCRQLQLYNKSLIQQHNTVKRTFLSNAYYCQEVWNSRLNTPILQKVNLEELYHTLDTSYNRNKNISAVDVDIFANAVRDDNHVDELLDLVHKMRLSAEASNNLPSTEHAVIRFLSANGHSDRLLQVLDDRLNYGLFLDDYTANLLFDIFWKKQDYTSGAKVASQIMLQENFTHPLVSHFALLHCFKFLQNPVNWEEPPAPEEPEDEVKIRVKFLRNAYFDDHFDLKNPLQIVGKTLAMAGANLNDNVGKSFQLVGFSLFKCDKAKILLDQLKTEGICTEIISLLPEENEIKAQALSLKKVDTKVQQYLEEAVKDAERNCAEKDITQRCEMYDKWITQRQDALDNQMKRFETIQRLSAIESTKEKLVERERLLWYFENKEQIELEIEGKKVFYRKRWFGKKKKPRQVDSGYIPPDIEKSYSKDK